MIENDFYEPVDTYYDIFHLAVQLKDISFQQAANSRVTVQEKLIAK